MKTELKVVHFERSGNLQQKVFISKTEEQIRETLHTQNHVSTITQIDTYQLVKTETLVK